MCGEKSSKGDSMPTAQMSYELPTLLSTSSRVMPSERTVELPAASYLFDPMARSPMPSHSPRPPNSSRRCQLADGVGSRTALFEMHGHCLHALQHALKTDQTCAQGAVRQHGLRNQCRDAPAAACPFFGHASGPSFARSGAPHAAALVAPRSKTMTAQQLSASLGVLHRSAF